MRLNKPPDGLSVADRWDRVFRLLSYEPRRQIILSLLEKPPDAWLALPEAALSDHYEGTREDLSVTLRHQHLPVLADDEHVIWRSHPFEVARGPNFEDLGVVLEAIIAEADTFPNHLVHGCESLESEIR